MQPSRWLVDNIANSSRVLLVLSPCTTPILTNSLRLSQRRPYPDLFVPAFDIIVRVGFNEVRSSPSVHL